jgi:hypothetical protein
MIYSAQLSPTAYEKKLKASLMLYGLMGATALLLQMLHA